MSLLRRYNLQKYALDGGYYVRQASSRNYKKTSEVIGHDVLM